MGGFLLVLGGLYTVASMCCLPKEPRGEGLQLWAWTVRRERKMLPQDLDTQPRGVGKAGPDLGHRERASPELS